MDVDLVGKAKRLRIYLNEGDRVGHQPAHVAILSFLRRQDAAGATVVRGVEGFGGSGVVHTTMLADIVQELPIVVEWIDTPERVDRLLPQLKEMVPRGLVTIDETEVLLYKPRGVRDVSPLLTASDVMARKVASVERTTPLRQVIERALGQTYRAVPVVEDGKPVGIITNSDLISRGGLGVRLGLLEALDEGALRAELDRVGNGGKTAGEVMTPTPLTVPATMTLPNVANLMASRRLKRLPVVDAQGQLVGVVSRLDLLRTVVQGFEPKESEPRRPHGLPATASVSTVMRKDIPTVHPDTRLPEVFQAVISTRLNRAVVVDDQRHVLGIVAASALLERVTPALHPSALRALVHRLPFVHPSAEQVATEHHASAREAADLMTTDIATASPATSLHDVIATVVQGAHKLVVIVDDQNRLVGAVDRADLLHGLVSPTA
jgi:CBS-domain-containing membrane protein